VAGIVFFLSVSDSPVRADSLTVVAVSDINGRYGSVGYNPGISRAVERAGALQADVFLIAGDMVAGQRVSPLLSREELDSMWGAFHSSVSGPLEVLEIPLLVTPGNHDASRQKPFVLERTVFSEQWAQRFPRGAVIDGSRWPFHYAVGIGAVLFVGLDATEPGRLPEAQLAWLDSLLGRHRADYKHAVVFGHLPLWPLAKGREREILSDARLRDLLVRFRVDAYLSGHHHAFFDGEYQGVRHVGQAALGGGRRVLVGAERRSPHAITVLEFGDAGMRVNAYVGPDFVEPLSRAELPRAVESPLGTLRRAGARPAGGGQAPASAGPGFLRVVEVDGLGLVRLDLGP
jgi:3',5'-cyclic AMP phosphodiesterase CpdA